jgi:hypothetical protein
VDKADKTEHALELDSVEEAKAAITKTTLEGVETRELASISTAEVVATTGRNPNTTMEVRTTSTRAVTNQMMVVE